jgi:hypothetical protein
MALIVEDGSIVPNADSYVSRTDVIAYALKRGITLPATDATDVMVIKAMDYLSYFDAKWLGEQVEPGVQSLAWPRKNVWIGFSHVAFPEDEIPNQLVRALCELTLQVNAGVNLLPTLTGETQFVTREKVDVIETEYSEAVALQVMGMLPNMPLVEAMLTPLMSTGAGRLRSVRI